MNYKKIGKEFFLIYTLKIGIHSKVSSIVEFDYLYQRLNMEYSSDNQSESRSDEIQLGEEEPKRFSVTKGSTST